MELCPVSEDDLALLQRLYSDPLAVGEHEWHGWQDTRWLRREWAENGLLAEDRGGGVIGAGVLPSQER